MSGALIVGSQEHFYLKLKTVNNYTDKDIKCEVTHTGNEDLIFNPSHWMMGIVSFNASLGASSLVFTRPDGTMLERVGAPASPEERSITYQTIFERNGKWNEGRIVANETRNLAEPSYNMADMFSKLNPSKETFSPITAHFQTTADGSTKLVVPLNKELQKKSAADPKFDIDEVDYRVCTECSLSQDLITHLDFTDQKIIRYRRNMVKSEQLVNIMDWFAGKDGLFRHWVPMRMWYKETFLMSDVYANVNSPQTLQILIPDAYFDANGLDWAKLTSVHQQFHNAEFFGAHEIEVLQYDSVNGHEYTSVGTFQEWWLKEKVYYGVTYRFLYVRGFVEQPVRSAHALLVVEDVFMRLIASMFQEYVCPRVIINSIVDKDTGELNLQTVSTLDQSSDGVFGILKNQEQDAADKLQVFRSVRDREGSYMIYNNALLDGYTYGIGTYEPKALRYGRLRMNWMRREVRLTKWMKQVYERKDFSKELLDSYADSFQAFITHDDDAVGGFMADEIPDAGYPNAAEELEKLQEAIGPVDGENQMFGVFVEPILMHTQSLGVVKTGEITGADNMKPETITTAYNATTYDTSIVGTINGTGAGGVKNQAAITANKVNSLHHIYQRKQLLFEDSYSLRLPEGLNTTAGGTQTDAGVDPGLMKSNQTQQNRDINAEVCIASQFLPQIKNIARYYGPNGKMARGKRLGRDIFNSLNRLIDRAFVVADKKIELPVSIGYRAAAVSIDVPAEQDVSKNTLITQDLVDTAVRRSALYMIENTRIAVYCINTGLAAVEIDKISGQQDRYIDFEIRLTDDAGQPTNVQLREVLDNLSLGKESHQIVFRQTSQSQNFTAEIIAWNSRSFSVNASGHTSGANQGVLVCQIDQNALGNIDSFKPYEGGDTIFTQRFPVANHEHSNTTATGISVPVDDVVFSIRSQPESVVGQLQLQGITQVDLKPAIKFKLAQGDYVKSSRPNADSLQYFSSLALVSSNGFLFQPTYVSGYEENVMLELPIPNPFSIGCDESYNPSGISLSAMGDLYYSSSDPRMHDMKTSIPLRSGKISVQLHSRDSAETIPCLLAPRGKLEMKILFVKKA